MIFDQQNMFFDKYAGTSITTDGVNSNVIANVGGGDAHNPLFLVIAAPTALRGGPFTAALQTNDSESFGSAVTLATYDVPAAGGVLVKAKLPFGLKKFIRLNVKGTAAGTGGTLTAGLTENVDNWTF